MRWTSEKDQQLKYLISLGKRHQEISEIMNMSNKNIGCRCYRLKIKMVYKKIYKCEGCDKDFIDFIKSDRKFCSRKCSSTGRSMSDGTKNKISEKLIGITRIGQDWIKNIKGEKNGNYKNGNSISKRTIIINGCRQCIYCKEFKKLGKNRRTCEMCRFSYYKLYRPSCEFKFDIYKYAGKFDFDLVDTYGWYSPSNKRNNLTGVSKDHLYSVMEGFINKISPNIISHPANCQLLLQSENSSKNKNSIITIDDLTHRINNW